ncbi:quorum-quenching N-acyl homoserine lactonase AiiA [Bacillus sp. B1-b2]|uniref:quorum-quenching N-acyl homoserine lactonase AiiA n=1 Tax=Bacillus sp. B1-b2 TaxID=2653201 RepID=UPI0012624DB6|nr:N-acyl homoserine lactonase family protein [Bacillus sp. B1-b2]KAB7665887.1 N-acyl homoserine lactonase family protein [Bacillus sp. B1-b2]
MIEKLYWLPTGKLTLDYSSLNQRLEPGKLVTLQIWSYLLETKDGPILIDTGMPESFIENPGYFNNTAYEGLFLPDMRKEDHIVSVLNKIGYKQNDIQAIISSHLHMDHAGGNPLFPNTPIYVQQAELDVAIGNEAYAPPECTQNGLNYRAINGDYELLPGIQLLSTPGHTPGHQSILVTTKHSGPILLTIDLAYTKENYEEEVPFATFDPQLANDSIRRIKTLMAEIHPTHIFYGHDLTQANTQKAYPDFS